MTQKCLFQLYKIDVYVYDSIWSINMKKYLCLSLLVEGLFYFFYGLYHDLAYVAGIFLFLYVPNVMNILNNLPTDEYHWKRGIIIQMFISCIILYYVEVPVSAICCMMLTLSIYRVRYLAYRVRTT
jgi:hypothetical protein